MNFVQSLDNSRQLPLLLVYSLALMLVGTAFVWIAIIVVRKCYDRDLTMPGITPSWWCPMGAEWLLHSSWNLRTTPIGEGLIQLFTAVTCMYNAEVGILRAFILMVPAVLVWKADGIETILRSNKLINKSYVYSRLESWLGTGLLTSNGRKWRSRRKMLTPAFHFRILEDFLPIFDEHCRVFTRILKQHCENRQPIDITPLATMATLDIICETAMGVKINAQEDSGTEYVKALYVVGAGFMNRLARPWLWLNVLYNMSAQGRYYNKNTEVLHNFTRKVIDERKTEMLAERLKHGTGSASSTENDDGELGVNKRRPFLNLLLETHLQDPQALPLEGIREEVDTFMFEGHDTTAMGISWALYLIAENVDAQSKIHQELDRIFGDDLDDRPITNEDLQRMKYLECCIKEAQRLFPSVPFIARLITEETNICGHRVKPWTIAVLYIYGLHRDPKVFPDPEQFQPERFLPENSVLRHPYAYVPFSGGPRNCIGQKFAMMELKVMIAWTLRRFALRSAVPRDQLHIVGELVTRSKDGLPLFFEPRTSRQRQSIN